jgi:S1-C subfamily serine protease
MSNVLVDLSNAMVAAVEKAGAATLLVNGRRRIPSSGIAYASDLILTADHTVEQEDGITIMMPDKSEMSAMLAGRDSGSDLAILRLDKPAAVQAEPAQGVKIGQLVLALGRPSPEGVEASLGVVSALGGAIRTPRGSLERYIRTDTTPYPGFSGGPLVDAEGRVAGVNTSAFGRGIALTIPADLAWKIAKQLAEHGSIKRGYIGIRSEAVNLPEAARDLLKHDQQTGLLVVSVEKSSPAEAGGMMVGDILIGLDDTSIPDHDMLFSRLTGDIVGRTVPVKVLRGGKLETLNVKIGERS